MIKSKWFKRIVLGGAAAVGLGGILSFDFVRELLHEQKLLVPGAAVVGRIVPAPAENTRVYMLREDIPDGQPIGSTTPGVGGLFAFLLPDDVSTVRLVAFTDTNNNDRPDTNEPGWQGVISTGVKTDGVTPALIPEVFEIALQSTLRGAVPAFEPQPSPGGLAVPVAFGEVASFSDTRLQRETGVHGLFRSRSALHQRGLGIYFLDEYATDRIPLIFVHGAGGTPQDFEWLIARIDTDVYQPWVFSYPSGLSLPAVASALTRMTLGLQAQYEFTSVMVVAHSMGGTVALAAVQQLNQQRPGFVPRFISLATPFGGHAAASKGVEKSPLVVPSWRDIQPGSEFLQGLAVAEHHTDHLMLISNKSKKRPFLASPNDGVVSVASQLHDPVKNRSRERHEFPLSHTGILRDDAVRDEILRFLK